MTPSTNTFPPTGPSASNRRVKVLQSNNASAYQSSNGMLDGLMMECVTVSIFCAYIYSTNMYIYIDEKDQTDIKIGSRTNSYSSIKY